MPRQRKINTIWSLGLSSAQEAQVLTLLGKQYQLRAWTLGHAPALAQMELERPCLILTSPEGQKALDRLPASEVRHLDLLPKVLLLEPGYTQADLETALDANISEILRPPYNAKALAAKFSRAQEVESVHHDVLCMTKEIMLEREILERKNEILNFLVNFLANTSESLEVSDILCSAFTGLRKLFPVLSLHAALWTENRKSDEPTYFYIATPINSPTQSLWYELLLEQTQHARPDRILDIEITNLDLPEQEAEWRAASPNDGHVLTLPIRLGKEQLGTITLLSGLKKNLSRDQAVALDSALRHLALTLKNAQRFQVVKQHAEHDMLTGVHSRRHFEQYLHQELGRAKRYAQPLSLLFIDLDHFKAVNDSKGHSVGDQVLRQVAQNIESSLRSSDYCARYGGEEFVVLLPHTDGKQAALLAERLRTGIAAKIFKTDEGSVRLTVSLGLASSNSQVERNHSELIAEADKALYEAKHAGRNCVRGCAEIRKARLAV